VDEKFIHPDSKKKHSGICHALTAWGAECIISVT
jgi:hypothetical protein